MGWFRIDDQFSDHPKVIALRARKGWQGALALWTLAGAWTSRQLQDGFVPSAMVSILGCTRGHAEMLVEVGLWERVEGGYRFHDFHDFNPTREQTLERREKTRRKVSEWRANRSSNQVRNLVTEPPCNQVTSELRAGCSNQPVTLPPSRPDPIPDPDLSPEPVVVDRGGRARARARDGDHHHDDGWGDELVVGAGCTAPAAEEARSSPQDAPRTPDPAPQVPQHPREDSRLSAPLRPATPLAVVHAAEEAAESARIAHEDRLVLAASGAYARALHAAGGIYDASPRWRDALRSVGRLAEQVAQRDGRELESVLREWAERYVRERETRRPDWWLERVTAWTSGVATAGPSRRNGRLPPGTGAGFPTGDIPPAPMPRRVYRYA